MRAKTFNIRFSDEEWDRLDAISNHYGLTAAGIVRMLLKREAQAVGLEPAPPPPPSRSTLKKKR